MQKSAGSSRRVIAPGHRAVSPDSISRRSFRCWSTRRWFWRRRARTRQSLFLAKKTFQLVVLWLVRVWRRVHPAMGRYATLLGGWRAQMLSGSAYVINNYSPCFRARRLANVGHPRVWPVAARAEDHCRPFVHATAIWRWTDWPTAPSRRFSDSSILATGLVLPSCVSEQIWICVFLFGVVFAVAHRLRSPLYPRHETWWKCESAGEWNGETCGLSKRGSL